MPAGAKLAMVLFPLYILVMGCVSGTLLWRYRENRYPPALLLGLAFGFLFGLAPFVFASQILKHFLASSSASWLYLSLRAGGANMVAWGWIMVAVFTWRVFRPGQAWALLLVTAVAGLELLAKDLTLMTEPAEIWLPWQARRNVALLFIGSKVLSYGWWIVESWSRGLVLGRDPGRDREVVRRFWLWGGGGALLLIGILSSPQVLVFCFPSLGPTLQPFYALSLDAFLQPQVPRLMSVLVAIRLSTYFAFSLLAYVCWARKTKKIGGKA